ncbi:hypothetical protein ACIA49_03045 [Kribbella sp. NPDC051587]|uniref:hypothetical protein n=1 Tax=Kribbella sp. NPDC051587 TaxID=3364119 RepID=UPI0037A05784
MTDSLDLLRSLDPVATNDPAAQVTAETRGDLLRTITATPVPVKVPVRRRLVPVLVAAAAVAAITVLVVRVPGGNDRPEALSFTAQGDVIKIRVVDPGADAERLTKELKAQGFDIGLKLVPVSPSKVGQTIARGFSGDATAARITTTAYPVGCAERNLRPCVPEFTIARDFQGQAQLYLGRAAEPGEEYGAAADISAPGEALAGTRIFNQPVAKVAKAIEQRGFSVTYRVTVNSTGVFREQVPDTWFVYSANASSDHHVFVDVGPDRQR